MKTIEQCLEGVTADGKWIPEQIKIFGGSLTPTGENKDCAYAARACSSWPELVKALDEAVQALENVQRHSGLLAGERVALEAGRKAVANALRE